MPASIRNNRPSAQRNTVTVCDAARGPVMWPAQPVCGNDIVDRGEHCSTCPADGVEGAPYPGTAACTAADPTYPDRFFTSHDCFSPTYCLPQSCGGWCPGFCDPGEGCVVGATQELCPGESPLSCNQQRMAAGLDPMPGGDVRGPPAPFGPLTRRQAQRCPGRPYTVDDEYHWDCEDGLEENAVP